MLKSVLFNIVMLFTGIRFLDMLYILSKNPANLPIPVFVVTAAMVLYGTVLIVRRHISGIRMKELLAYYLMHAALVVFNLTYVSIVCPLQLDFAEILLVGTFLDLIVDACVVYHCVRQMRRPANIVMRLAREGKLRV